MVTKEEIQEQIDEIINDIAESSAKLSYLRKLIRQEYGRAGAYIGWAGYYYREKNYRKYKEYEDKIARTFANIARLERELEREEKRFERLHRKHSELLYKLQAITVPERYFQSLLEVHWLGRSEDKPIEYTWMKMRVWINTKDYPVSREELERAMREVLIKENLKAKIDVGKRRKHVRSDIDFESEEISKYEADHLNKYQYYIEFESGHTYEGIL
ncbi:MAG: hypothetical protein QW734_03700 [Candidatus Bathyarchaeia archaeon]